MPRVLVIAGALLVAAVALYARVRDFAEVFTPAGIRFVSGDAYLHVRRIVLGAQSFPAVPYFDPYNGFPAGIQINWPPLWDFAVVALAELLGLGRPAEPLLLAVAAVFPVLVGLALLPSLAFVARRLFGPGAGWAAAAVATVYPALVYPSLLGNVDHHAGVELTHSLLVAVAVALLARPIPEQPLLGRAYLLRIALLSAAVAAAMLTWLGAIFLVSFVAGFFALLWLVDAPAARGLLRLGGIAYLVAAVALIPFVAPGLTFMRLSWFHVVAIGGVGAVQLALATLGARLGQTWRRRAIASAAAATVLAIATAPVAGRFWGVIVAGLIKVFGRYPWAQTTNEWQPLLLQNGQLTGDKAETAYGFAVYLLPLALAALLLWHWRLRRLSRAHLFFYGWTIVAAVMAGASFVHFQLFGPSAVLLLAGAAWVTFDLVKDQLPALPASRRQVRRAVRWALVVLVAVSSGWIIMRADYYATLSPGLFAVMDWLRINTPPTRAFAQGGLAPEYGVLSAWAYGDAIAGAARRPAVANGDNETNLPGFVASQQFFQSLDEESALRIARENGVRYVVVGRQIRFFSGDLWAAGPSEGMPQPPAGSDLPALQLPPSVRQRLVFARLYDGPRGGQVIPMQHFRLIHAGVDDGYPPPNDLYVYELVKGARLVGTAGPGEVVAAELQLSAPGLGVIRQRFVAQADAQGHFDLAVPYATTAPNYDLRALGAYRVTAASGKAVAAVGERAVLEGEEVAVVLAP